MTIIEEAHKNAIKVLDACSRKNGFFASGLKGGYEAVWARDSMIASLGAALVGKRYKAPFQKSIELLSKHQSPHGQIPNAVGCYNAERRSDVTFNSIDSTLWYIIGHSVYMKAYQDDSLWKKYRKNIDAAFQWLSYQDTNEDGLLVQQPTMDWQDAFPHKYGRVLNTQALYFLVLNILGMKKEASRLKKIVNGDIEKYISLYDRDRGYYLPWIWKTHGPKIREQEHWFDTLGNIIAIIGGMATQKKALGILNFIEREKINRPYPCKAIFPPIEKGDLEWKNYFDEAESRRAYHYLNGGIWPCIGGFYVVSLVAMKQYEKAKEELELLARANRLVRDDAQVNDWGFQEWLHGQTGRPAGGSSPYQAWSAGMYIVAHHSVIAKKASFFQ